MSLINQMLQDLEQRSVGSVNSVPSGIHGQIRAVPERRRIHPAWWLVLLLSVFLAGAVAWYLTRPAPPAQAAPNLALRIAPQLGALPSPVAQEPLPLEIAPPLPLPATAVPAPQSARETPRAHEDKPHLAPREDDKGLDAKAPEPVGDRIMQQPPVAKAEEAKPVMGSKQVSELTPQQHAENEFREAATLIQAGKQPEAITMLQMALKLDARHAGVRETLIGLLLQVKRNDDALKVAQDGLALDSAQPGLTMVMARIQLDQGDLHAALATMEHGMPYMGANAEYHAFMAALLMRDKRSKEAIEQYTISLTAQPQNGVWWMGLGMALQSENHLPEAREAFVRAKRSDTLTPELLAFVEQKLVQLGKP
jgi:MSHA biogenesis protein MshN